MWQKGMVNELLAEGQTLQDRLPNYKTRPMEDAELARQFRNLMTTGNISRHTYYRRGQERIITNECEHHN